MMNRKNKNGSVTLDKITYWAMKSIITGIVIHQKADKAITYETPPMKLLEDLNKLED
jgi:hypothetical protein